MIFWVANTTPSAAKVNSCMPGSTDSARPSSCCANGSPSMRTWTSPRGEPLASVTIRTTDGVSDSSWLYLLEHCWRMKLLQGAWAHDISWSFDSWSFPAPFMFLGFAESRDAGAFVAEPLGSYGRRRQGDRPADADQKHSAGQLLLEHRADPSSCFAGSVYTSRPGSPFEMHDLCPHTGMWVTGCHPRVIALF